MNELYEFDAEDLGCGTGLPKAFLDHMRAIPVGAVLRTLASDPAAREDLPSMARMLGHSVHSIEEGPDGRLVITVERKR